MLPQLSSRSQYFWAKCAFNARLCHFEFPCRCRSPPRARRGGAFSASALFGYCVTRLCSHEDPHKPTLRMREKRRQTLKGHKSHTRNSDCAFASPPFEKRQNPSKIFNLSFIFRIKTHTPRLTKPRSHVPHTPATSRLSTACKSGGSRPILFVRRAVLMLATKNPDTQSPVNHPRD